MKIKNIKKALNSIIVCEGVALATFIPNISKMVSNINQSVHADMASATGAVNAISNVATSTNAFGFNNLVFLGLLAIAIGLPTLDVILKTDKDGGK